MLQEGLMAQITLFNYSFALSDDYSSSFISFQWNNFHLWRKRKEWKPENDKI